MRRLVDNARGIRPKTAACCLARWGLAVLLLHALGVAGRADTGIGPAPPGEELSRDYTVMVEGQQVPVYAVKVAPADPVRRWKAMDDKARSAEFFDTAAFATFDMPGPVKVTVTCKERITSAKILPTSFQIVPEIQGKSLTLAPNQPRPVTVEINGNWVRALHLFANPPEAAVPLRIELNGFDEAHAVENVLFQDVVVNGKPLVQSDVKGNAFVRNIRVQP